MKLLFDTNIVLDVLLDRHPHVDASASAWAAIETGLAEGFLAAHAVTTVHYLIQKQLGSAKAKRTMASILRVFSIAAVNVEVLADALQLPCPDFEDSVAAAAAHAAGCHFIVTRDPKGFRGSPVRLLDPQSVVPLLDGQTNAGQPDDK